ncbi:MAG: hypothetical protein ACRD0U_08905 [Acidimicrobiales bacterium]
MAISPGEARSRPSLLVTFAGLMAVVVIVAGLTGGGYQLWKTIGPEDTGGTVETDSTTPAPGEGQSVVTGTITSLHVEGASLAQLVLPAQIVTLERGLGSGATFEGVVIEGAEGSIEWDAGRPLDLASDGGALVLAPGVVVNAVPEGITVTLDGPVHSFLPATYHITSPVAVGTSGIAQPVDSVTFDATEASTVTFRGGASTTFAPQPITLTAEGPVTIGGTLTVARPDGQVTATSITLASGLSQLTLTPGEGGLAILATLQGETTIA